MTTKQAPPKCAGCDHHHGTHTGPGRACRSTVRSGNTRARCDCTGYRDGSAQRVQLQRAAGWRKPEGCISVARPSRWGNPWVVGDLVTMAVSGMIPCPVVGSYGSNDERMFESYFDLRMTPTLAVALYRRDLLGTLTDEDPHYNGLHAAFEALRGHDLACWCAPEDPCHVDVLLELLAMSPEEMERAADDRYDDLMVLA